MTVIKIAGLPDYTPKRTISVVSTDAQAYYEAAIGMAKDHVVYLRGRTTDPWADQDAIPAEPLLRKHYAELIKVEQGLFEAEMGLSPAEAGRTILHPDCYFLEDIQHRWEGWLLARLGFLPETRNDPSSPEKYRRVATWLRQYRNQPVPRVL